MEYNTAEEQLVQQAKQWWTSNETLLRRSILSAFVFGLVAHAYGFLNLMIGHDSLNEFYAGDGADGWKIQLGRVLVPLYRRVLRGPLTLGWMIGLTSLLWLGLTVFLVAKLFQIHTKPMVALMAAVLVTNITVTAQTATYIYELDINMFALLLAAAAAYLWRRGGKYMWLGIVPAAGTLGLYQSYFSVTVTLIMLLSIMALLCGEKFGTVMKKGIAGLGMLLGGGACYLLLVKLVCAAKNISLVEDSYNSITKLWNNSWGGLAANLGYTYRYWVGKFLQPVAFLNQTAMLLANVLLICFAVAAVVRAILTQKLKLPEAILLVVLGSLLPLGMNLSCWLNAGVVHHLMIYAFWFAYLFVILLVQYGTQHPAQKAVALQTWTGRIALALVAVVVWNNIGIANAVYLKRDLLQQATLSTMTRVVDRMEQQDGYVPGVTKVAFIGQPDKADFPGFEECSRLVGMLYSSQITYYSEYNNYFRYILSEPLNLCSEAYCAQLLEREDVKAMPAFPQDGCVQMIGEVMVVKLAEPEN